MSKSKNKKREVVKKKYFLIPTGLVGFTILCLLILSYLPFYPSFVPRSFVYGVDSLVASLPFLPKTAKQITTKALLQNTTLKSYSYSTDVKLSATNLPDLLVKAGGKVNKLGLFSSDYNMVLNLTGLGKDQSKINFSSIENIFYFRLQEGGEVLGLNLNNLGNNWYEVDLENFQKSLGVTVRSDKEVAADIAGQFQTLLAQTPNDFFAKVKLERSGQNYKLTRKLETGLVGKIFKSKESTALSKIELTALVNKNNFYLHRIVLKAKVNFEKLKVDFVSAKEADLTLTYQISDLNKIKEVSLPAPTEKIATPLELSLKILGEGGFFEVASQSGDLATNFLTLERLLKVFILLPKAI